MSIETAGGSGDRSDFEIGDRMIDDFKIGLEVGIVDLLEEDIEFIFDLFGLVEEIKLISFFLGEGVVNELLELFRSCFYWKLIDSK